MLQAFLTDLGRRPFALGACDCMLPLADWWSANHGVDPAAAYRGAYDDEASCVELLKREGALPRFIARLARQAGARKVVEPRPGDLAIVRIERFWWGAIRTDEGFWAVKDANGLNLFAPSKVRVVAAWSLL